MCNLSQGILERGIEQGIEQGIERGKLLQAKEASFHLYKIGLDEEAIANTFSVSVTQVREWLATEQP